MDPTNQPQLTDNEQMILGAQQAALLQQMHDKEIETKAIQQQHLIQEEKILEAQTEALAIQQMQQVQEMEEQRHEAELHHLQTMAIIEQEKEVMLQQQQAQQQLQQQQQAPPPPQPVLEGAVLAVPGQPPVIAAPVAPILLPQGPPGPLPPPAPQPILNQQPPPQQQPPPTVAFPGPPPPLSTASPMVTLPPGPSVQQQAPITIGVPPQGQQQPQLHPPSSGPTPLMSIPHINPPTTIAQGPPPPIAQTLPPAPVLSAPAPVPGSSANLGPGPFVSQVSTAGPPPPLMSQPIPPHVVTQSQGKEEETKETREEEPPPPQKAPAGPVPAAPPAKSLSTPREIKLPQALEKVLAFKGVRAQQMGVKPEDVERVEKGGNFGEGMDEEDDGSVQVYNYEHSGRRQELNAYPEYAEEEEEDAGRDASGKKESKNKKRKKKKKRAKARKLEQQQQQPISSIDKEQDDDVEVEYIQEDIDIERSDPSYSEFSRIFQAFKIAEDSKPEDTEKSKKIPIKEIPIKARGLIEDDDDDDDDIQQSADDDKPKLSKKKLKKMNRLSVAELKQLVARPDVVEMHDVTARDPKLLVHIKATRNSVPVPRHWCFKRKYLQGKRGIEKPPFDLPHFIKATGIMEMRQALQEKEDQKTLKSKMRERVRPKMGKIDIDYQKLHDAFFKWQTKPKLSIHGDLYYEGKEFETRLKEKKPGNLTDELRTALGMPIGGNADKYPPPWLIAQQRYGPPPSYPNLKIPGLNAPIPDGCAFGYHAGGWGKPPVDEAGKPLYGDVFGTQTINVEAPVQDEDIDKSRWGELESESEEEESEEEEQEEEEVDATGLVTPGDAGLITPSGVTSVPVGMETPDMIELRKRRIEDAMDQGGDTPALYQVLPEKKATVGGAMMGSAHVYDISAAVSGGKKTTEGKAGPDGVEVALNPDELDLDTAAMQAKYEQTVREQQSQLEKEDLSDMVAEHAAKQQKKRKKQAQDGKSTKKYKEFKF